MRNQETFGTTRVTKTTAHQWGCSQKNCKCTAVTLAGNLLSGTAKHDGKSHGFGLTMNELLKVYISEQASDTQLNNLTQMIEAERERRGKIEAQAR